MTSARSGASPLQAATAIRARSPAARSPAARRLGGSAAREQRLPSPAWERPSVPARSCSRTWSAPMSCGHAWATTWARRSAHATTRYWRWPLPPTTTPCCGGPATGSRPPSRCLRRSRCRRGHAACHHRVLTRPRRRCCVPSTHRPRSRRGADRRRRPSRRRRHRGGQAGGTGPTRRDPGDRHGADARPSALERQLEEVGERTLEGLDRAVTDTRVVDLSMGARPPLPRVLTGSHRLSLVGREHHVAPWRSPSAITPSLSTSSTKPCARPIRRARSSKP